MSKFMQASLLGTIQKLCNPLKGRGPQQITKDYKGWGGYRGQTNTDNPAEYGYIRNRIVPLGMKRISIWTIRYSFDTLRNRSIENPVPFYPLRNTYKNYPFQTDNQTDNKVLRRAKSLKDDMAKKTLSKPKFSLRKCSLWESMSSNDPWLNPFLDSVENRRCLTFNIISIKKRLS